MANISQAKKTVQADPEAAIQSSLDAAMAKARQRLLRMLFWAALVIAAMAAIYLRGCG